MTRQAERQITWGWPSVADYGSGPLPTAEEFEQYRIDTASPYELQDCEHGYVRISCVECRTSANAPIRVKA